MKTIEQENVQSTSSTLNSLGKLRISDSDSFFDEYAYGSSFNMNRNINTGYYSNNKVDSLLHDVGANNKENWVIIDDAPSRPENLSTSLGKSNINYIFHNSILSFFLILRLLWVCQL